MDLARRTVLLCALALLLPAASFAQSDAAEVRQGCDLYSQARFDEAISTLERVLLQGSLTSDERLQARICLARAYVKAGNEPGAREVFKSILRLDPAWVPDEFEVPPDEIAVFRRAREEMEAQGGPAPDIPQEGPPAEVPTPTPAPTPVPQEPTEISQDDGGKPWWLWPLVGVVAVGGAIVALAGGGDEDGGDGGDGTLPDFPDPPGKQPQPQPQ